MIAFASLLVQIAGLVGDRGVLPASIFLEAVHNAYGARGYWLVPTIAWINSSTIALQIVCAAGVLAGALLMTGRLTLVALATAWALYLSLLGVGQVFLSFQWDLLLLEAGVLAVLATLWPQWVAWLFRWLLFRLMFLSGAVKLLSGDESWANLTALTFHFQTQPLPNVISWYVQQLPPRALEVSTAGTLATELFAPLLYFAPRSFRLVGAVTTIVFQTLILLTGNYTFFNLLTISLAVWLLDDDRLERWLPGWILRRAVQSPTPPPNRGRRSIVTAASVLILVLSATQVYEVFRVTSPEPFNTLANTLDPLHLTSRYGLFAVMTTTRPEIVFEGSNDGVKWEEYEFTYKPGDLRRPPPWAAPHQPRLDWQMWFAALSDATADRWVVALARRLLEGSPDVMRLFARAPGNGRPPRYVRALLYDYRFTDRAVRASTGRWWSRQLLGSYLPPLVLDETGALRRADLPSP